MDSVEAMTTKRKRRTAAEVAEAKAAKEAERVAKQAKTAARKAELERKKAERMRTAAAKQEQKAQAAKAKAAQATAKAKAKAKAKTPPKPNATTATPKATPKSRARAHGVASPLATNSKSSKGAAKPPAGASSVPKRSKSLECASRKRGCEQDDVAGFGTTAAAKRQRTGKEGSGELAMHLSDSAGGGERSGVVELESKVLAQLPPSEVSKNKATLIANELNLPKHQVAGAVKLFEAGNTLSFIARYRKEQTGCLNEDALRRVERSMKRVEELEERRASICNSLAKMGKLEETKEVIQAATSVEELEDIYAPHKAKRRTRAQLAEELGLGPLADLIDAEGGECAEHRSPEEAASELAMQLHTASAEGEAQKITPEEALAGARDIVANRRCQSAAMRAHAREMLSSGACLATSLKTKESDPDGKYQCYWNFRAPLSSIWSHQFLAIQRGEKEKVLSIRFECAGAAEEAVVDSQVSALPCGSALWKAELRSAVADGLTRLLKPTIEREWRRMLKERAEDEAFDTYRRNAKAKLLTPPCVGIRDGGRAPVAGPVMGLDPGYRHGCKIAVVSSTGGVLATLTIYPVACKGAAGQNRQSVAQQQLVTLLEKTQPGLLAIGNGTASAETEAFVRRLFQERSDLARPYSIVDESGASIYSASELAAAELPDMDVTLRGAVSIARRALDPLAELVKIDPQSLGVGMYQHDVEEKRLKAELKGVVEECVNAVGVDVNTASAVLLQHVAGIGAKLSQAVIEHREAVGPFTDRRDLKRVKGLGAVSFQQAAGFLRIIGGMEPLDATAVHPESYVVAKKLQECFGTALEALHISSSTASALGGDDDTELQLLAQEVGCGKATLADIIASLRSDACIDPRSEQPQPLIKDVDAMEVDDLDAADGIDAQVRGLTPEQLEPGMVLRGIVRNVVQFGAFMDIGVHHDALLHYSCYPKPLPRIDWPRVNDRFAVEVKGAERRGSKWRISIAMPNLTKPQ